MAALPSTLACGVCAGLCKRAVKAPCCTAIACRPCAVKEVTKHHKCWNEKCGKDLKGSGDLVNNDSLRAEIESLGDGTLINCGLCKEMCKRGAKIDCCEARACRACAIKEITKSRSCWSCSKSGVTSENLVNDDLLRSAVDHFKSHKIILPEHKTGLSKKPKIKQVFNGESKATTSFHPNSKPTSLPNQRPKTPPLPLFGNSSKTLLPSKTQNNTAPNYFERPVPELKVGHASHGAPRGRGGAVADNDLLGKRLALFHLKQRLRGAAAGPRGRGSRGYPNNRGQESATGGNTSPLGPRGRGALGSGATTSGRGPPRGVSASGNANTAPLGQRKMGALGGLGEEETNEGSSVTTLLGEYAKYRDGGPPPAMRGSASNMGGLAGRGNSRGALRGRGGFARGALAANSTRGGPTAKPPRGGPSAAGGKSQPPKRGKGQGPPRGVPASGNANTAPLGQRKKPSFGQGDGDETDKTSTVTTLLGLYRSLSGRDQANGEQGTTSNATNQKPNIPSLFQQRGEAGGSNRGGFGPRGFGDRGRGMLRGSNQMGSRGRGEVPVMANDRGGVSRGSSHMGSTGRGGAPSIINNRGGVLGLTNQMGSTGRGGGPSVTNDRGGGVLGGPNQMGSTGRGGGPSVTSDRGGVVLRGTNQMGSTGRGGGPSVANDRGGVLGGTNQMRSTRWGEGPSVTNDRGGGVLRGTNQMGSTGRGGGTAVTIDTPEPGTSSGKRSFEMMEDSSEDNKQESPTKIMKEEPISEEVWGDFGDTRRGAGRGAFGERGRGGFGERGGGMFGPNARGGFEDGSTGGFGGRGRGFPEWRGGDFGFRGRGGFDGRGGGYGGFPGQRGGFPGPRGGFPGPGMGFPRGRGMWQ